jgi:hypothetical protein
MTEHLVAEILMATKSGISKHPLTPNIVCILKTIVGYKSSTSSSPTYLYFWLIMNSKNTQTDLCYPMQSGNTFADEMTTTN